MLEVVPYALLICRKAEPNDGHYAIANLEKHLGDRYSLITQNIDGLHLRAGSSMENAFKFMGVSIICVAVWNVQMNYNSFT